MLRIFYIATMTCFRRLTFETTPCKEMSNVEWKQRSETFVNNNKKNWVFKPLNSGSSFASFV